MVDNRNTHEKAHPSIVFIRRGLLLFAAIFVSLVAYLIVWAVLYRIPAGQPILVDKHTLLDRPCYIALCSSLADNPHGFPGHAYVVWSETMPIDLENADARGFVPRKFFDQIPALWRHVPGVVVPNASDGNKRNFNAVVVMVDRKTFDESRARSHAWISDNFKVGSNDCVGFAHSVASCLGLNTPDPRYRYPQDYVRQLKELNKQDETGPTNLFAKIE